MQEDQATDAQKPSSGQVENDGASNPTTNNEKVSGTDKTDGSSNPKNIITNDHIEAPPVLCICNRQNFLPWNAQNRTIIPSVSLNPTEAYLYGDATLRPGEIVMRSLFLSFIQQAERKIELVMLETHDKSISKLLQRGENPTFDQLLSALGSVAEHCLPSLIRALIAWHTRQLSGKPNFICVIFVDTICCCCRFGNTEA